MLRGGEVIPALMLTPVPCNIQKSFRDYFTIFCGDLTAANHMYISCAVITTKDGVVHAMMPVIQSRRMISMCRVTMK